MTNDDPFTAPNLKGAGYEQQYFLTSVSTNAGTERDMEFIRTYPVKPSSIYYAPPERPPSI
ncbi:MAG: hypothetical protein OEY64_05500 [Nitrospinota bacterium]|nr:hypothetical protein [Nitrospinota bacterium]